MRFTDRVKQVLAATWILVLSLGLLWYGQSAHASDYEGYEFSPSTMSTYLQESADHADAVNAEAEQQMYDELATLVADYATGNDLEPAGSKPPPPLEVYTGAWSHHLGMDAENENHQLFALSYGNVVFSSFKNSYNVGSYSVGYLFRDYIIEHVEVGAQVGVVYGYEADQIDPAPCWEEYCLMVVPQVAYTKYMVQPVVSLMGRAVVFSIRWRFH